MADSHSNHCAKCGSPYHHMIECTVGENPVYFSALKVKDKFRERSESSTTQEGASSEGDLINFDEDHEFSRPQSSHTSHQSDLKDLTIEHVNNKLSGELSSTTPNYEALLREDIEEAIRRSLVDQETLRYNVQAEDCYLAMDQEQMLSDNQNLGDMALEHNNINRTGADSTAGPSGVKAYRKPRINDNEWETVATPKTLKNREFELVPKSSFLAFQQTTPPGNSKDKGKGKARAQESPTTKTVTRTLNSETNTMTVSSLQQKRRGRRNRHAYYDITPELQYLR